MAQNGKSFKRAPRFSSKEKKTNFICPKAGDTCKVYVGKNKRTPDFAGVVKEIIGTDTQVRILIEVVSSSTIKPGKTVEMSYLLHKDAWQKVTRRDIPQLLKANTEYKNKITKKKHCSNELYTIKIAA